MKTTLAILAGAAALAFGGIVSATPPTGGAASTEVARSQFRRIQIDESEKSDIVVAINTYPSKATSGWHAHPGDVTIGVKRGQITITHVTPTAGCVTTTYHAGDVFRERPGDTYLGRNRGDKETILIATFYGVPPGGETRIDRDKPDCAS